MFFPYGQKEMDYLGQKDKRLGAVIERLGFIERPIDSDIFTAVVRAILGQQISRQARETVYQRLVTAFGEITPIALANSSVSTLQAFGMTFRKAEYLQRFAETVCRGELDLDRLTTLSDAEVIKQLSAQKGIGVWTAEMLLISKFLRPDVISFGDLAILRGMRMLYRHKTINKACFARYQKRYSPYASTASVYLWAISAGAIPEFSDPKNTKKTTQKTTQKTADKINIKTQQTIQPINYF